MYKILYLDDEKDRLIKPIIVKLESTEKLKIELKKPVGFEQVVSDLEKSLNNFDALFLDLQLDGEQEHGYKTIYQAPPLAHMVRMMATEGRINDLPILLCSTEEKIKRTYNRDFTSHDLFDWTFTKDEITEDTIEKICSVINGYKSISKDPKNFSLHINREFAETDERALSRFINEQGSLVHEISRYIFNDIVKPAGLLINEAILAARLGIDRKDSADWENLKEQVFEKAKYKGVFGDYWQRWWSDKLLDIFEELTDNNLASLSADERVKLLIDKTGFKGLKAFEGLKHTKSKDYWSVCEITELPIDPYEAYKIDEKHEPKPWQEYSYVSLFAMSEKPLEVEENGIEIHFSDAERYKRDIKPLMQ